MNRITMLGSILLAMSAGAASAQPASSAAALVQRYAVAREPVPRAHVFSELRHALGQSVSIATESRLDSIADGLVAIAVAKTADDPNRRGGAITILELAGSPAAKIPYKGALDRLKRIYETAPNPGIRGAALGAMAGLAARADAIAYLSMVARTASFVPATRAIETLSERLGDDGRAALAEMDRAGTVTDVEARAWLRSLAPNGYKRRIWGPR